MRAQGMHAGVASTSLSDCCCRPQVDMTNIPDYNPTSDAIQLRPFELLLQVHNERFPYQTC